MFGFVLSEIVRNCWNLRRQDRDLRPQKQATQSNCKQDARVDSAYLLAMMKQIIIIKRQQSDSANGTSVEKEKADEPSTRNIVNTVKGWIAESQERKRSQRRSLSAIGLLVLITFAVAMAQSPAPTTERQLTPEERAVKVTITTTQGFLGPAATRYKVGEQIPVNITMTNTSTEPVYTCISSDLYQDLPRLTRDGKAVPLMNWQSYETLYAKRNRICQEENLPEPVLLKPNEPTVADWFVLVDERTADGADAWYDTLPAGKYELTIQRRLACCDGPMVESNKVSFEVVP